MTTRLQQNIRNKVRQATKIRYELWLILIAALVALTYGIFTAPDTGDVRGAEDAPTAEELAASPAKRIAADVISKYPNAQERVNKRTATSKTFYLGEDVTGKSKYTLDTSIGPIHYQDAQGAWQEIDTTIESDASTWDWKMEKAVFQVHGKSDFTASEVVEFTKDNEWVRLTPSILQYSNDAGDTQPIALPKTLEGALKGSKISWANVYGPGLDFSWEISPSRLAKLLTINNKSDLPPVQKVINDGKNPVLELSLQVAISKGAAIFIDGKEWQGEEKDIQEYVEFRDNKGNTLWHFAPPFSWDSSDPLASDPDNPVSNQQLGTFRFKKSGDQLSITHRVPLSFIEKAVFPVMIDATLEVSVAASADDVYAYSTANFNSTYAYQYTGSSSGVSYYRGAQRYTNITIPQGATINTGTYVQYVAYAAGSGTTFLSQLRAEAADNATQITCGGTGSGCYDDPARTLTTAKADWDSTSTWTAGNTYGGPGDAETVELQSVIQEVISRAGWASGNAMNIFWKDDGSTGTQYRGIATWDHATYAPPKLHIEYTVAAPATISGNIYTDEGSTAYNCSADNLTVRAKVNGLGDYTGTCTLATGAYSITNITVSANDIVTVFLDGETPDAVTITKYNTGDLNNLHLYQNHVITRAETGSLTIDNMDNYDKGNDADILFTATNGSPDTLTVDDGQQLFIWSGDEFAPGGNVSTQSVNLAGTYTAGSGTLTLTTEGTSSTCSAAIGTVMPFCINGGVFTANTSTVKYDPTTENSVAVPATTYYNLEVRSDSGLNGPVYQFGTASSQTITIQNNLNYVKNNGVTLIIDAQDYDPNVTVNTITNSGEGGLWSEIDAGDSIWTITGTGTPFTLPSVFNACSSTFRFTGNGATTIPATTYYNLEFKPTASSPVYSFAAGTTTVNNNLVIGNGAAIMTASTVNNPAVTVTGDLTVDSSATLSGAGSGNFYVNGGGATGNGTITLTGGTFRLDDAGNFGGNTAWTFYNLTFGDGSGTTTTTATGSGGITVSNTLTIASNQELNAGSKIWTLSASGTPFSISGTFTSSTSTINYTATSATNVTGTTYYHVGVGTASDSGAGVTYTLGGSTIVNGVLTVGNASSTNIDTLNSNSNYLILDGGGTPFNITPKGDFTEGAGYVFYRATSATNITATTYWRLYLRPSGAGSPTYTLGTGASQTINADYELQIGDGAYAVTVSTTTWAPTINVGTTTSTGGKLVINDYATLSGAGNSTITVMTDSTGAGIYGLGTVNLTGGTVEMRTDQTFFQIIGTTGGSNNWTFNNLKLSNNMASNVTIAASSGGTGTTTIKDTLTIGNAGDTNTTALNASNRTWILTKNTGQPFVITSGKGVFTASSSTFRYDQASAGSTNVTATTYYNLDLYGTVGPTYILGTAGSQPFTINNNFNLDLNSGAAVVDNDTYDNNITTKTLTVSAWISLLAGSAVWTITGTGTPVSFSLSSNFFDPQTSTFRYTGTSATTIADTYSYNGYDYYNLETKPASGSPTHSFAASTFTIANDLVAGNGTNAVTLSTANSPLLFVYGNATIANSAIFDHAGGDTGSDITITGDLTINGTLSGSGDGGFQARGNVVGAGTVNLTACTFKHWVASSKNFGANSGSNNWTFYSLRFYSIGGTPVVTTSATGTGQIIILNTLNLSNGGTSLTVDNNTNDRILDVNGSVTINANTTLQASNSAAFTVGGSWSNSGNFTANGGTVTFDDNGKTSTFSGTTSFYNLYSSTASKNMTFTASTTQTVGGTLTFNGGACGTQIVLRSSSTPTQWNINVTGSSTVNYVNVKDSNASGNTIVANYATNAGHNTNWTFGSSCGPSNSQLMRHGKWFNSSGIEQPFTF